MSYILAILGLSAACVAWVLAQRWAGLLDDAPGDPGAPDTGSDCDGCEIDEAACPVVQLHEQRREYSTATR